MNDFERGVRFAMQQEEHYTRGVASDERLQFGSYVYQRRPRGPRLDKSKAHLEKRIRATLLCARAQDICDYCEEQ